ncbi:nucleotidyltransferase domain-containing protein [Candidatus Pacearchaeota archaeon]|nr:nucleotidyltransferase domain-containing protein [Candidatus Pacearchaeota archaeon]
MLNKYNRYKLLRLFLDSPTESFRLREIARLTKISPPSVINYLKEFEKDGLIRRQIKREIPFYNSIRDNSNFILYKKISILFELNNSGLIDYLWDKLSPEAIILYGSFSRGESIENSDVDLFILGKNKNIDLINFEKKLNKRLHILFKESTKEIPNELKNNILNGIILKGYIKVF